MTLVHAVIGLGEALITGLVLRTVLQVRPDLIDDPDLSAPPRSRATRWGQVAAGGLAVALAVAVFLGPLASTADDGLETVGNWYGFLKDGPPLLPAPMPDYALAVPGVPSIGVATAAAGAVGTVVVFVVGLGLARALGRRAPGGVPDAA